MAAFDFRVLKSQEDFLSKENIAAFIEVPIGEKVG